MKIEMLMLAIKKENENGDLVLQMNDEVNKVLDDMSEQSEEMKELNHEYNRIKNKINMLNAFILCKTDYADEVYKKVTTNYIKERNNYVEKIYGILQQIRDDVLVWSNEIEV